MIDIWHYSAREHGLEVADEYIRELDDAMLTALEYPKMGADCSQIRNGYRRIRAGSHLIYYIPHKNGIEVIRVLHAHMDAARHLTY